MHERDPNIVQHAIHRRGQPCSPATVSRVARAEGCFLINTRAILWDVAF